MVPTVGRERTVLVVENDAVVWLHPGGILCMLVQEVEDGLDMLVAMPSGQPVRNVVIVHVSPFRPLRFEQDELFGYVSAEDREGVERAISAVFDLSVVIAFHPPRCDADQLSENGQRVGVEPCSVGQFAEEVRQRRVHRRGGLLYRVGRGMAGAE
ncbi:hypothetical protein [Streptomyces sp. NEAU-W12]|uniref:hypothetical protein n=1 Tax=Streptomyces sp. NEAU-W12 TaxID=2994668 RepID=UPI00224B7D26|nr:hypothetical protein [Streptomyces sp. NEAU-W12]MCX2927890.1 hypothetical protein [Streptomyces sp. NEAU-W12]